MVYTVPVILFLILWVLMYWIRTRRFVVTDMWSAYRFIRKHRR